MNGRRNMVLPQPSPKAWERLGAALDTLGSLRPEAPALSPDEFAKVAAFGMDVPE